MKLEMKVAIKEYYPAEKVQRISTVSLDLSVPSAQVQALFDAGKKRFLQEALIMKNVHKQANRIKCATIGWKAMKQMIEESEAAHE